MNHDETDILHVILQEQLLNSQSHGYFNHMGKSNISNSTWPHQVSWSNLTGTSLCWSVMWITHGRCCLCEERRWATQSQAMSLALSLKHLIRTVEHFGYQQSRSSDTQMSSHHVRQKESGIDHAKLSCKPEGGGGQRFCDSRMPYTWEQNEIIHSSIH